MAKVRPNPILEQVRGKVGDLVKVMVDADMELIGLPSTGEGRKILEKHHGKWHRWEGQVVSMGG
jgi:hypothetical protein